MFPGQEDLFPLKLIVRVKMPMFKALTFKNFVYKFWHYYDVEIPVQKEEIHADI